MLTAHVHYLKISGINICFKRNYKSRSDKAEIGECIKYALQTRLTIYRWLGWFLETKYSIISIK